MFRRKFITATTATIAGFAGCASNQDTVDTDTNSSTTKNVQETDGKQTSAEVDGDGENKITQAATQFYNAFGDGDVDRANKFAHPESPSEYLPVTEDQISEERYVTQDAEVVERNENAAAVKIHVVTADINVDEEGYDEVTQTIGLRLHNGKWLVWRLHGCEKVSC